jgi:hypothetical protein
MPQTGSQELAPPTQSRRAVLLRVAGILLVGIGIGLLACGTAVYGAHTNGPAAHPEYLPLLGSILIGWGAGCLAVGVLTVLYRHLP